MEIRIDEALRYLGMSQANAALRTQIAALAEELQHRIRPRFTWVLTDAAQPALSGRTAERMLADCTQCAVLVCTLGAEFDLWVRREQARDMSRAVMLDALGSAYVEAGCDAAEDDIRTRFPGKHLTDRFSPGYGDFPLAVQRLLLDMAGARRIGVTVTDSLLMNPQKSVTAVIGIANQPQAAKIRGCAYCALRNTCQFRKGGRTCHV